MESDQDRAYGGRLADWEIATIDELAQEALDAATMREFIRHEQKFLDAYVCDLQRDCIADTQIRRTLAKARARLDAKAQGKTLTYCRQDRGTHSVDHVWDPAGTDTPPNWWNMVEAKADHDKRQERAKQDRSKPSHLRSVS